MMNVPQDRVAIDDLTITNSSGSKSEKIAFQVMSFLIEEDITSSYVEAQINVLDGIGLINTFPIVGEEKINISFTKYTGNKKESLTYTLMVYAVENLSINTQNNVQAYMLKAISEEVLISGSTLSQKAYNSSYEDMIQDILSTDIKTSKPVNLQKTNGVHQIIIPYKKPLAAIDMVRKRATSSKHSYSPMVFFETKKGYQFRDLVSMYEDRKPTAPVFQYYNTFITNKDVNREAFSIINFSAPEKHNSFDMIDRGSVSSEINEFDLITKSMLTYRHDLPSKISSFNFFNKSPSRSPAFVDKYNGNIPAVSIFMPIDSTKPKMFIDQFNERRAYLNMIMQNYSKLETIGSLEMQAGDIVDLRFNMQTIVVEAQNGQKNNARKPDDSLSGLYMIKKLIHEVTMAGSGPPTYRAHCDLIRGSTLGKLT